MKVPEATVNCQSLTNTSAEADTLARSAALRFRQLLFAVSVSAIATGPNSTPTPTRLPSVSSALAPRNSSAPPSAVTAMSGSPGLMTKNC